MDELLERSKNEYVAPSVFASLYADLGEISQAYEFLEESYAKRDIFFVIFIVKYRNDPRFNAFFKKVGL